MISKLTSEDFKARLEKSTIIENSSFGFYFITPYNYSGESFVGKFDSSTFELSRNSFWNFVRAYKIKGDYHDADRLTTEVSYQISRPKILLVWIHLVFMLAFLGSNVALLVNLRPVDWKVIATINGVFIFMYTWQFILNKIILRMIHERFKTKFEIEP
jgi:hypothetical protein